MNRVLRAATVGVLLLTPVALSACSAGQVTQTGQQMRDKVGPSVRLGDISLRQVRLAYPTGGTYQSGSDAELRMSIANSGAEDDALVGISGEDFSSVRVTGTGVAPSSSAASASATGSATATATATATASTSASATATSGAPSSPATPTPATSAPATDSAGGRAVDIPVPADQTVFLGQNAPTVTLAGLKRSLTPAQTIPVTFTFRKAGRITIDVGVATPGAEVQRTSSFNFQEESSAPE